MKIPVIKQSEIKQKPFFIMNCEQAKIYDTIQQQEDEGVFNYPNNDEIRQHHFDKLRTQSGNINSDDPLVSFLYILMRDYIPVGAVESILIDHIIGKECSEFTNGWLAEYAKYVAEKLYGN